MGEGGKLKLKLASEGVYYIFIYKYMVKRMGATEERVLHIEGSIIIYVYVCVFGKCVCKYSEIYTHRFFFVFFCVFVLVVCAWPCFGQLSFFFRQG